MLINRKNKKREGARGFSLIEILLTLVILFLIIGGMATFSVQTIESHTKNQAMQNAMDNARFAIESLSKQIRTSREIDGNLDEIFFVDNVNSDKYCYFFDSGSLKVKKYSYVEGDSTYDDITDCNEIINSAEEVVSGDNLNVTGGFDLKETDDAAHKRGFVRISINVEYQGDSVAEQDEVTVQSGVSLRDY
jgi:prepilin-type N-terminal cleavage/methylation domain-containing protein